MKRYLLQIAIAFDQLINTIIPGGWADETLSSRAYRMRSKNQRYWGWTANVIDAMFFFQKEHCYNSWLEEVNRQQSHPSTRRNSL